MADKSRSERNQTLAGGSDHSRGLESTGRKGRDLGRGSTVRLPSRTPQEADAAPEGRFVLGSAKLYGSSGIWGSERQRGSALTRCRM